eukprot:UN08930
MRERCMSGYLCGPQWKESWQIMKGYNNWQKIADKDAKAKVVLPVKGECDVFFPANNLNDKGCGICPWNVVVYFIEYSTKQIH